MAPLKIRLLRIKLKDDRIWPYKFTFWFEKYYDDDCPAYGILSHRWLEDNEEVQYRHIVNQTAKWKEGFEKLLYCATFAYKDGLKYIWVDSCCIIKPEDGASKYGADVDESEVMRHMFKWYQQAEKCYVYLKDVYWSSKRRSMADFAQSKWHQRGWTLQELIAPEIVEFYDCEGTFMGEKRKFADFLSGLNEKSPIPKEVIRDPSKLKEYSPGKRLRWADGRKCKYGADYANCVIGLCGLNIRPCRYDVPRSEAWERVLNAVRACESEDMERAFADVLGAGQKILKAQWRRESPRDGHRDIKDKFETGMRVLDMDGTSLKQLLKYEDKAFAELCVAGIAVGVHEWNKAMLSHEDKRCASGRYRPPRAPGAWDKMRLLIE